MGDKAQWNDFAGHETTWNDDEWVVFSLAAKAVSVTLGWSIGVAERTLRELCAKGDIRSIRATLGHDEDDPEVIKPSQWLHSEVDLEGPTVHYVSISVDDYR